MRLRHFSGKICDVEIVDKTEPLLRVGDGDPFGPLVAGMMFESFPECIVDVDEDEERLLKKGGFVIDR